MSGNTSAVSFFYGNPIGRGILKFILFTHADKIAVSFLRSRLSKPFIRGYVRKNSIPLTDMELTKFRTYNEFFTRTRENSVDTEKSHLISPCDGLLSVFPIEENSTFLVKGSTYRLSELFGDDALASAFCGGDCLIFRLCPSDYHHYCYIDNGYQHENHFIEGKLHSVQPIACEKFPVYALNRRSSALIETENFGKVVQTEVGALVVGGIVNPKENTSVKKGEEKGYFDLAGSTVVLFFQKGRIELLETFKEKTENHAETPVRYGEHIGYAKDAGDAIRGAF